MKKVILASLTVGLVFIMAGCVTYFLPQSFGEPDPLLSGTTWTLGESYRVIFEPDGYCSFSGDSETVKWRRNGNTVNIYRSISGPYSHNIYEGTYDRTTETIRGTRKVYTEFGKKYSFSMKPYTATQSGGDQYVAQAAAPKPAAVQEPVVVSEPVVPPDEDFEVRQNRDGVTLTITDYKGSAKNIIIPKTLYGLPVTVLGISAFEKKGLTGVVIPEGVTTIETGAFYNNKLTNLIIPDSVTAIQGGGLITAGALAGLRIGSGAFEYNQLSSVTISNSVTSIGGWVFHNNQLTSVIIPDSVISIEDHAFDTNKLTSLTIPNSVTSIGNGAFDNNQLTSLTIGNNIVRLASTFENNRLTSVIIPNSVTVIEENTFKSNQLTSIAIPDSVTEIGSEAFALNKLASIILGKGLRSISRGAFRENQLTSITITKDAAGISTAAGFEESFINFYESQKRSPGTYVKNGPIWRKQ